MSSLFDRIGAELRRGLLQIAALSLLQKRLYGYQLVKILASHGLDTEEGTLYPLLRRLETQGLLRSEWDTEGTRPRKYYVLTAEGQKALPQCESAWREVAGAVSSILEQGVLQPQEGKE
ncbi:MAG: PadR family transcriptional regulator [Planctomycetota bacterium]